MTSSLRDMMNKSFHIYDDTKFMRHVVEQTKGGYTCNRPPGAAGAAIVTEETTPLYASVFPPDGSPTCKEVGCEIEYSYLDSALESSGISVNLHSHCVRTIHAEQRLIAECAKLGICTQGATVYSILKPCYQCTKILITAGVKKIFYASRAYDEERTRKILENAGVECIHVDIGLDYGF